MKLLLSALGFFLLLNTASAATTEHIMLSKNHNQCLRSLPMDISMHTARIAQDQERLGGRDYKNPYLNIEIMLYINNLGNYKCAQDILAYIRNANAFYQDYGAYCIYGKRSGTEADNRLGFFERQRQFYHCGL